MRHESYIRFDVPVDSATGKTRVWPVLTREPPAAVLGHVRWFGPWRCYAFFPVMHTVFERHCLRDIADFCELVTRGHREWKRRVSALSARAVGSATKATTLSEGGQALEVSNAATTPSSSREQEDRK